MFRIGQKVVCVETADTTKLLKKGEIYKVQDVSECGCGECIIHIGLPYNGTTAHFQCGHIFSDSISWVRASRFRPIDEAFGEQIAEAFEQHFAFATEPADLRTEITA